MKDEKQKALIEQYIIAYNNFNVDGMVALVHPQIVFKNISGNEVSAEATGVKQFRDMAIQSKELFSSRQQKISNFSVKEGLASVDIDYEGILLTDLPNGLKAGEKIQLRGRSEYEFADGKIITITDFS